MVPLRDDNPIKITPYVTYGLIALNLLIFFYEVSLPEALLDRFFDRWAVVPVQLTASFVRDPRVVAIQEWETLISSQFLHGGLLHVAGNMLYLWIFGNNLEEQFGRLRYLLFYLTCGALAVLTQWYFDPFSATPSLGASGAIAGVMGAYILRFPEARILTVIPVGFIPIPLRIPALFYLGFWFLQQSFYGLMSLDHDMAIGMAGGGIAYWAHAGGFVFGAILGPFFGLFDRRL